MTLSSRIHHTKWYAVVVACLVYNVPAFSADTTVVERYGALRTAGNRIVGRNGNPVVLRGMSLYWSQWKGQFYNYDCVKWLRDDWKCSVVRASMAVESGGFLTNGLAEKVKVKNVINACIDLGIYVIVDWHDHHGQWHTAQSIAFFEDIARQYKDKPNIIYEIYNEPLQVSWADSIKPYADTLVKRIRAIDPNNLIVVGNPTWSQDVDVAAANPVVSNNIAYTLHFYAATHKSSLRVKASVALSRGAALFATEFGTTEASGTGKIDSVETGIWLKFLEDNKISWCNWSVADLTETSAALKPGASGTGGWPLSSVSTSGLWLRTKIREGNAQLISAVQPQTEMPRTFGLRQNYPNPFNPTTTVRYELSEAGPVSITVHDVLGRRIDTLVSGEKPGGQYSVQWDAANIPNGTYFCRMRAGAFSDVKRMIVMK